MRTRRWVWWCMWLVLNSGTVTAAGPFAGRWESDFGLLELVQEGTQVRGTYSCCKGVLEGEVVQQQLKFRWEDPVYGNGWGVFTLSDDGRILQGVWGKVGSLRPMGQWRAVRSQQDAPAQPQGEPSYWQVEGETAGIGPLNGSAELYFNGDRVSGKIEGYYTMKFQDKEIREDVFNTVEGTQRGDQLTLRWRNPLDGSTGTMNFTQASNRWQGHWRADDGASEGSITFIRQGKPSAPIDLNNLVERRDSLERAEKLIRSAANRHEHGDYAGALAEYRSAAEAFHTAGNRNKEGYALYGMGQANMAMGNYQEARQQFAAVLDLGDAVDSTFQLLAHQGLEIINQVLGLPQEGLHKNSLPTEPVTPEIDLIEVPGQVSRLIFVQRDYPSAIALADRALVKFMAQRPWLRNAAANRNMVTSDLISMANLHVLAAQAYFLMGQYDQSIKRLEHALEYWRQLQAQPNIATTLENIAGVQRARGDLIAAEATLAKALEIGQRLDLPDIWRTYYAMARLLEAGEHPSEAARYYEASIGKIESLRGRLVTDESKVGFFAQTVEPYEDYVAFLLRKTPVEVCRGLEIAERARARALLDSMMKPKEQAEPMVIKRTFGEIPSPYQAQPLSCAAIRDLVRVGSTYYLAYFVTRSATFAWVIAPSGDINAYALPVSRDRLTDLISQFRSRIEADADYNKADFIEASTRLYEVILAPLQPALQGLAEGGRITLLPHQKLNLVPFTALWQGKEYWGTRYQISMLPSFGFLQYLHTFKADGDDRLLAIGSPAGADGLVNSKAEVEEIVRLYEKTTTLLEEDKAVKERIIQELPAYQLVLFSTHGYEVPGKRNEFYLLTAHQSMLTQQDIQGLDLSRVKLVALSACSTHTGNIYSGDELMSLSRAFLTAGVNYVLASLWQVDDKATGEIMTDFFKRLSQDKAPAAALHQAQLVYLKAALPKYQRPRYWVPWILIGPNI